MFRLIHFAAVLTAVLDPSATTATERPNVVIVLVDDFGWGEAIDLTAKQPDKVKELQVAWDAWNKTNVAALWGGRQQGDGP